MTHIVSSTAKEKKMGGKRGGEKNKNFYIKIRYEF